MASRSEQARSEQGTRLWAHLDEHRQEQVRHLVVDALGLTAAGTAATDVAPVLEGLARVGGGAVRVPWTDLELAAPQAVAAFSTLIHAWDFDDTHDEAVVHTASVVVPAAFAACRTADRPGLALLDGVVTGIQVLARLARLTGPRPGVIRTAGLGSIAAAAAAATAWGLDDAATESAMALSLVAALAPTTRQAVVDGSVAKRLQPGLAAQAGLSAAALAAAGVAGPRGWLSGTYGLLPGTGLGPANLFDGPFEGDQVALKPYPACRYTHAALAAAETLRAAHPDPDLIERVTVHVPAGDAYVLVSRPYQDRGAPLVDAQFSIPWQLSALWTTGRYDLSTLHGGDLGRADIAAWAARVPVRQDLPESTVMSGARVEITTTDGRTHTAESPMPGSGEHRLDAAAVDRKLESCLRVAGVADPRRGAEGLWALVKALPDLDAAELAAETDRHLPGPAQRPSP